ncbi:hypothetical protein JD844_009754 [Phrynosoma platyrhinos]|uniref:Cystatin domain-containing protein n=1 Tax=Phrynosoma platyrhinos TaxID=52577 RepID=A0ABQ7TG88_PHRPL|nr:hypothetical protein JD844_009754 [Phrynosoma platyrhinos]
MTQEFGKQPSSEFTDTTTDPMTSISSENAPEPSFYKLSFIGTNRGLPNSTIKPGFPVPVKTNDPGVRQAARFGVYGYNNSSNDIYLFRESCINKATLQIVRGLKYTLNVEIRRTVCSKRPHPDLDRCAFQRNKKLRQKYRDDILLLDLEQELEMQADDIFSDLLNAKFISVLSGHCHTPLHYWWCTLILNKHSAAILKSGLYLGYRESKY